MMNIITFIIFGIDKYNAKKRKYRVPEKVLFLLAILGGSIGALAGMYLFRHKTQKLKFKIGIPLILVAQTVVFLLIYF